MTPPIFLIGPMGAGKSTTGRCLAQKLGWSFMDSDEEIEKRFGVTINRIFEQEGEAGFRRRERQMIDQLTTERGIVLATGGGVIMDAENRRHLTSRGVVVYLQISSETQWRRVSACRNRPLLQTDDPQGRLQTLMEERDPYYRQLADHVVDSNDDQNPHQIAEQIMVLLGVGVTPS